MKYLQLTSNCGKFSKRMASSTGRVSRIIFSVNGGMGPEAHQFHKLLCSKIAEKIHFVYYFD